MLLISKFKKKKKKDAFFKIFLIDFLWGEEFMGWVFHFKKIMN